MWLIIWLFGMKQNKAHFRSRNAGRKQNSAHTIGVNTVIDSNGPCGKIRGTAAQVMEKYLAAAKDASGADRVLYENCMQHAEHFFRIHAAAVAAEAERRESFNTYDIFNGENTAQSDREDVDSYEENQCENDNAQEVACTEADDKKQAVHTRKVKGKKSLSLVAKSADVTDEAREEDADISADIMNLDVSFPDVSKMGKPQDKEDIKAQEAAEASKTVETEKSPKLTLKRNGGKTKKDITVADVTGGSVSESTSDKQLVFDVETVTPARRTRCRKVQGL